MTLTLAIKEQIKVPVCQNENEGAESSGESFHLLNIIIKMAKTNRRQDNDSETLQRKILSMLSLFEKQHEVMT